MNFKNDMPLMFTYSNV